MSKKPNKPKKPIQLEEEKDTGGIIWAIAGFLVAPAGFFLWLIWRSRRPKTAAMCLRGAMLFVLALFAYNMIAQIA